MFGRISRLLALAGLFWAPSALAEGPVHKVVPAGPPAAIDLLIVAPDVLAGWPGALPQESLDLLPPGPKALPVIGRLTGRNPTQDAAGVKALAPDLVIDIGDVTPAYAELAGRIQQETGIRYVLLDGALGRAPALIHEIGDLTGSARAAALEAYAARVLKALPAAGPDAPRVYYGRGSDGLNPVRPDTLHGGIVELAGARNAVPAGEGQHSLSLADVAALDPDFILLTDQEACAAVGRNADWARLRAVQAHQVLCDPLLPLGWTDHPPSLNRLLGVQWLAQAFHPAAAAIDLKATVKAFAQDAYGIALTDAQVEMIVGRTHPAW